MTQVEAEELYQKFCDAPHDAFSKHEIWVKLFFDGEKPRKFDEKKACMVNCDMEDCDMCDNGKCTATHIIINSEGFCDMYGASE